MCPALGLSRASDKSPISAALIEGGITTTKNNNNKNRSSLFLASGLPYPSLLSPLCLFYHVNNSPAGSASAPDRPSNATQGLCEHFPVLCASVMPGESGQIAERDALTLGHHYQRSSPRNQKPKALAAQWPTQQ